MQPIDVVFDNLYSSYLNLYTLVKGFQGRGCTLPSVYQGYYDTLPDPRVGVPPIDIFPHFDGAKTTPTRNKMGGSGGQARKNIKTSIPITTTTENHKIYPRNTPILMATHHSDGITSILCFLYTHISIITILSEGQIGKHLMFLISYSQNYDLDVSTNQK